MSIIPLKRDAVKFKDDDYETGSNILKDLVPFIKEKSIIYDPFYCNGKVIKEWEKLGFKCINEKKDAFDREHPKKYDVIISNIPFTCKEKCMKLGMELDKPFMFLMSIDSMGSRWIKKYFDKLEFLIPDGRYNFIKNGEQTKGCWFDTMWVCYKMNLPKTIIKLNKK
mgnify:CR=1 FL=1|tara:strand:+ start:824 stop:1324 length:501 start_codon:yes stop_codon:yes gene_type:complete